MARSLSAAERRFPPSLDRLRRLRWPLVLIASLVRLPPAGAISDSRRALYVERARRRGSELRIARRSPAPRTPPPRAIEAVFAEDFGRSVYLIPLSERRASLRTVDWVKDASVARFWPNRVVVGVTERKPVAFVDARAPAGVPR